MTCKSISPDGLELLLSRRTVSWRLRQTLFLMFKIWYRNPPRTPLQKKPFYWVSNIGELPEMVLAHRADLIFLL